MQRAIHLFFYAALQSVGLLCDFFLTTTTKKNYSQTKSVHDEAVNIV